VMNSIQ